MKNTWNGDIIMIHGICRCGGGCNGLCGDGGCDGGCGGGGDCAEVRQLARQSRQSKHDP